MQTGTRMPRICLSILLMLFFSSALYGSDRFSVSLDYSPGITDYVHTAEKTRTLKIVSLGGQLQPVYLFNDRWGAGALIHMGVIRKLIVKKGEAAYTSTGWDGTFSQFSFSPGCYFIPFSHEKGIILLGAGPSVTLNFYHSGETGNLNEQFYGLAFSFHSHFYIEDHIFVDAGFRFALDFISAWDGETDRGFFQTQSYPSLGLGYSL